MEVQHLSLREAEWGGLFSTVGFYYNLKEESLINSLTVSDARLASASEMCIEYTLSHSIPVFQ